MEKRIKDFRDSIKIKLKVKTIDGKFQELYACYVLDYISETELVNFLFDINWHKDESKINFLMGKNHIHAAEVYEPLSEEQARLALIEFRELVNIKKTYNPSTNYIESLMKGY